MSETNAAWAAEIEKIIRQHVYYDGHGGELYGFDDAAEAITAALTAEALADAYEAEIQARGIPPLPELRQARLDLAAGTLRRLNGAPDNA